MKTMSMIAVLAVAAGIGAVSPAGAAVSTALSDTLAGKIALEGRNAVKEASEPKKPGPGRPDVAKPAAPVAL